MQKKIVAFYVGQLFIILSFFMLLPAGLAVFDKDKKAMFAYFASAGLSCLIGFALRYLGRKNNLQNFRITRREAFGIVALGWMSLGVMCGIPFLVEGSITHVASAIFEAVSGLTTTGATVIQDIEGLSRATHLWRVLCHWIGGMGIVVLFVAIFPQLGLGGKHLFKTEVTGPISEGLKPRIKQTALRLWWVYLFFTATCTALLYLVGLPLFDALCHALSTLSTGGFSTKSASVGAFKNPSAEWIVIFFMLAGGINFALYYNLFRGKVTALYKSVEVRYFVLANLFISLFIFLSMTGLTNHNWLDEFREALFQTLAVTTTTGLMTADFDTYPIVGKYLLFLCMFIGGCAGSTAGGLKVSRVLIVIRRSFQEIRLALHPQEVVSTKLGQHKIPAQVINTVFIFAATYILLYTFGVLIMFVLGHDAITSASSVIACLASVGPGFGSVGPTQSYETIHPIGKLVLCFFMIAGRLEIFVLLSLFTPSFWRQGR